MRNTIKNNCITQGIKISSKRMRLLDKQRKTTIMEKKDLKYIEPSSCSSSITATKLKAKGNIAHLFYSHVLKQHNLTKVAYFS